MHVSNSIAFGRKLWGKRRWKEHNCEGNISNPQHRSTRPGVILFTGCRWWASFPFLPLGSPGGCRDHTQPSTLREKSAWNPQASAFGHGFGVPRDLLLRFVDSKLGRLRRPHSLGSGSASLSLREFEIWLNSNKGM